MDYSWQKISINHQIKYIDPESDECYFLMEYTPREYTSGPGYEESEANSRIYNFKTREQEANSEEHLRHVRRRRLDFAKDLRPIIESLVTRSSDEVISLMFVPTSKQSDDPDYNNGFETVCDYLKEMLGAKIVIERPVKTMASRESSSLTGGRRDELYIEKLKSNLKWLGFDREPNTLIIFDDVITTGAHFTALKELIATNSAKSPEIVGLFWALSRKPMD